MKYKPIQSHSLQGSLHWLKGTLKWGCWRRFSQRGYENTTQIYTSNKYSSVLFVDTIRGYSALWYQWSVLNWKQVQRFNIPGGLLIFREETYWNRECFGPHCGALAVRGFLRDVKFSLKDFGPKMSLTEFLSGFNTLRQLLEIYYIEELLKQIHSTYWKSGWVWRYQSLPV